MTADHLTLFTLYPPPLWIASPRARVYRAASIKRFAGYLSRFEPADWMEIDRESLEATITLTRRARGELL